jgi:2,3-bisphosphoglycerate-dependent phosphoglycerate mutase
LLPLKKENRMSSEQKETIMIVGRHGNTFSKGDVVTRVGGRTDMDLSPSGLEQGIYLGYDLTKRGLVPKAIYTTTMKRTKQTAAQAKTIMGLDIPTTAIDTFNEIDYGPDENRPETEVVARLGKEAITAWDENYIVPDGWLVDPEGLRNSWKEFGDMVLREHYGQIVLNITHNGIARFASALLAENAQLVSANETQKNLKLGTGAYGLLVHNGSFWECREWDTRPPPVPSI